MNVGIIGFDVEGRASYNYFHALGATITICDQKTDIPVPSDAKSQLGPDYLKDLNRFDLILRTPGINPNKILAENPTVKDKISSCTNEFLKASPTKNIIGVTGTKGKGTTSTLIAQMLTAAGFTVHLGGNIGRAALDMLPEIKPEDWVVLELSSFQLTDLKQSPHIAVCVLVVPEHLDWHGTEKEYHDSKANLFAHQGNQDIAIYYAASEHSSRIAHTGPGMHVPYYDSPGAQVIDNEIQIDGKVICKTSELKLLGKHNWQNVCAAVTAVWQVSKDIDAMKTVLTSFSGLPHRIEFVREVAGVRYYNDSYATGLHATEAAIKAVPGPIIEIIGGYDRMLPLENFAKFAATAQSVRRFLVIGECSARLIQAFKSAGVENYTYSDATTIESIVKDAQALAKSGDAILFSPGFASFDMFKNFEIRGNLYRDYVNQL